MESRFSKDELLTNLTIYCATQTIAPLGGHFLEWEEPELVARDMRAFFSALCAQASGEK